jgi:enediyne biosynthesis protein E3
VRLAQGRIQRFFLGLSLDEATFARRGFRAGDASARLRLEQVGRTFLHGYHAALDDDNPENLSSRLNGVEADFRGFAFEGAAMGLFLLDHLTPWRRDRLPSFLAGPGSPHIYMVYVGAGWALAQLRRGVPRALARFDPLLGWLAVDGYGFHQGYFHPRRSVGRRAVPRRLSGYALRVFDQGVGRSLWFVEGADVARIAATVAEFPVARQPDLWSGVGLACAYAGGADREAIEALLTSARAYRAALAQGAAFAAKARQRAGIPANHTDLACRIIWGLPALEAARATDIALVDLPAEGALPAYEVWRQRIQELWVKDLVTI